MKKSLFFYLYIALILAAITAINHQFFSTLGLTGITMLYLLLVVGVAYFQTFYVASSTAFITFFIINYFFVEPRYTFLVNNVESWASLLGFLVVSLVVTSLVKRLKLQTNRYMAAYQSAEFSRKLAEHLAFADDINHLMHESCQLLKMHFDKPFSIATNINNEYVILEGSHHDHSPDKSALEWVASNGKPIGPHTNNWPNSPYWLIPFNRLPSKEPILLVSEIQASASIETYTAIRSATDQIATAYQRLVNLERAKSAELIAHEEAIQSALLASIAHDMRTPLTSILGAATTLQQKSDQFDHSQLDQLTAIITSQAQHLANTTENILSLIRLESSSAKEIPLDLQSPEELIGVVMELYHNRGDNVQFKITINDADLLIKTNAHLFIQALVNLIENAKEANTSKDHSYQTIEIDVYKENNQINISVSDHGKGFSKDFDASKIKKFSSDRAKGFGLGLSIVYAITKMHQASLTFANRTGGGACVTLSFNIPDIDIQNV
ncbi:MAG: sensor histidine kinase [Methylophilus sp.]